MKTRPRRKKPELVLRDGKPAAVILDLGYYQEMLERLEDLEDLRELQAMRKKPLKFRRLEDFLREHGHRVTPRRLPADRCPYQEARGRSASARLPEACRVEG